ncbi:hypothetical protein PInf_006182 [Phytophthora infestans]|nr:hypothetical protein PInf_006182 [Phytophthora infestans]
MYGTKCKLDGYELDDKYRVDEYKKKAFETKNDLDENKFSNLARDRAAQHCQALRPAGKQAS